MRRAAWVWCAWCAAAAAWLAPAAGAATIHTFTVSPTILTAARQRVTLRAEVAPSARCLLSSRPRIASLPRHVSCAGGAARVRFTLPGNTTGSFRRIAFTLRTAGSTRTVSLVQAAAVPTARAFAVDPTSLPGAGGTIKLSARVSRASSCRFSVTPALPDLPRSVRCPRATASTTVSVPASTSSRATTYTFTLLVTGAGGAVRRDGVRFTEGAATPTTTTTTTTSTSNGVTPIASPPFFEVCNNASELSGPATPPAGAVVIPAGEDLGAYDTPDTTYYFAAGIHTLGAGEFSQIIPGDNDTYIGAPGAILSGQFENDSAFTQTATGVTIEYLTIEDFTPPGGQGAVNHDSGADWTIEHDTIENNAPGAGVMAGTDDVLSDDCLTLNGEYGFDAYAADDTSALTQGPSNVTISGNEISDNDTCNWEDDSPDPVPAADIQPTCAGAGQFDGCGCSGGGKLWEVDGATIDGNWVVNNFNAGLWADTDNTGLTFDANTIDGNYAEGLIYELGYNAVIDGNLFEDNAWGAGPGNPGFPTGALYVSESGGDSRVPGPNSGVFQIDDNQFYDNWSGVLLWEDANRFCGNTLTTNADDTCTLIDPSVYYDASDTPQSPPTAGGCGEYDLTGATPGSDSGSPSADYYDNCRWKTQNVSVSGNVFYFLQSAIPGCEAATNSCGENGIFSEYGTEPAWSPYKGFAISDAITTEQNNLFADNTYAGPWSFMYYDQSDVLTLAQWQAVGQDAP